jgi:glycosyltransferase involved in cell wall biosynthesis
MEMVRGIWPNQVVAHGNPISTLLADALAANGVATEAFFSSSRVRDLHASWKAGGALLAAHAGAIWVVWCHHFDSCRWLQQRLALSGRPFIVAERNMAWDRRVFQRSRLTRPLKRRAINRAFAVAVPGRAQADMYVRLFGVEQQKMRFIPNSRPVESMARMVQSARSNRREFRLARRLPVEGFVVLCLGRLDHQKAQEVLIRAMAQARLDKKGLHLCLAGDGPLRADYEALAAAQLGSACTFLGDRDDVIELLACADAFALPSRYEGLSGALIEAMAAGVPVVASDIHPNRELVCHNVTGLLFEPESDEGLRAAIIEILKDREGAERRSAAAREFVTSSYDGHIERSGWIGLLAAVAASPGTGRSQ